MKHDERRRNNSIIPNIPKAAAVTAAIIALLLCVVYMIMAIDGADEDEARVVDGVYYPSQEEYRIDDETGTAYVNDIIIVYFNDGTKKEEREKSVKSVDGEIVASDEFIDMYTVKVKQQSLQELKQICEMLNKQDCVDEAMCDYGLKGAKDSQTDAPME